VAGSSPAMTVYIKGYKINAVAKWFFVLEPGFSSAMAQIKRKFLRSFF
jgi:hypothetical protein